MQMDTRRLARVANIADELATLHLLSFLDRKLLQVCITRLIAEAVVDGDHIAIAPVTFLNIVDHAIARSIGLGTHLGREIDTAVELLNLINGIGTIAEI